jgi:signal peptidase I
MRLPPDREAESLMKKLSIGWKIGLAAFGLFVVMVGVLVLLRTCVVGVYYIPSSSMEPTLQPNDHITTSKLAYSRTDPRRGEVVVFRAPRESSPDGSERMFVQRVIAVPGDTIRITPGYVSVGRTQYNHADLRSLLGEHGTENSVKIEDGTVLVNGKPVSSETIARAAGEPKAKVKIVPGRVCLNRKVLSEPYTAEDADCIYPGFPNERVDPKWIVLNEQHKQCVKIPAGKLLVMGDNRNDSNDSRFWGLLDRSRVSGKVVQIIWPSSRAGIVR